MPDYKAPLRDIRFVRNELLDYPSHYNSISGGEDATVDMVDAILEEGAKFCEQVLSPLNQIGDEQGCTWSEEGVTTQLWEATQNLAYDIRSILITLISHVCL